VAGIDVGDQQTITSNIRNRSTYFRVDLVGIFRLNRQWIYFDPYERIVPEEKRYLAPLRRTLRDKQSHCKSRI